MYQILYEDGSTLELAPAHPHTHTPWGTNWQLSYRDENQRLVATQEGTFFDYSPREIFIKLFGRLAGAPFPNEHAQLLSHIPAANQPNHKSRSKQ